MKQLVFVDAMLSSTEIYGGFKVPYHLLEPDYLLQQTIAEHIYFRDLVTGIRVSVELNMHLRTNTTMYICV